MQRQAAQKIDKGITGREAEPPPGFAAKAPLPPSTFTATKGKQRKRGTGCITQISEHLWEGRYTPTYPDGKRHPRNVYAHSEEECEAKLAQLIREMKAEIAMLKAKAKWQTA